MSKKAQNLSNNEKLVLAVINNELQKAENLIAEEADVNYIGPDNYSLLSHAAIASSVQMTQMLLNKGANVNHQDSRGKTPLHYAVENKSFPILKLLLSKEADVDRVDNAGSRPIDYAQKNPQIQKALEAERKKAFTEELGEIFNDDNLKPILYDFHKGVNVIPRNEILETKRRMAQTKIEAMTMKEAILGKDVVALQDIHRKDRGAHIGSRGGAGAGRGGGRG